METGEPRERSFPPQPGCEAVNWFRIDGFSKTVVRAGGCSDEVARGALVSQTHDLKPLAGQINEIRSEEVSRVDSGAL